MLMRARFKFALLILVLLVVVLVWPASASAQEDIPDEAYACCIYGTPQFYALSCEARAAVDWAAFFGYAISEYDFLVAMPSSDNPEEGFVGYWDGIHGNIPPNSYGVHPPPVARTLREFGVPAEAKTNLTWDDLRREIAAGRPVIVWVISQMWPGTPVEYTAENGDTVIVAHFEHTMILTGYSETRVQVVDPYSGTTKSFYLEAFLSSWSVLGNRAVIAGEPEPTPTPTQTPTPTATPTPTPTATPFGQVTVKAGDTLVGISAAHEVTWQALVSRNELTYPYFIYPGDVLFLPQ